MHLRSPALRLVLLLQPNRQEDPYVNSAESDIHPLFFRQLAQYVDRFALGAYDYSATRGPFFFGCLFIFFQV